MYQAFKSIINGVAVVLGAIHGKFAKRCEFNYKKSDKGAKFLITFTFFIVNLLNF